MGTWDDGLYDNDSALDRLGDLVALPGTDAPPVELAVGIALVAWLNPTVLSLDEEGHVAAAVERGGELPDEAQAVLAALARDLEGVLEQRSRSEAVAEVLGGYCDGPRLDPLLRLPGAGPILHALGERAGKILDRVDADGLDLYEIAGDLGALGIVIALADAKLWRPEAGRLAEWRVGFARADKATREERGFWDVYARRVRLGFELVARA